MIRKFTRGIILAAVVVGNIGGIQMATAQSTSTTTPPAPVTGTNPEPQVVKVVLINVVLVALHLA